MATHTDLPERKPAAGGAERKRARDARYNASEKGRARHRRYNQSESGLARYKRYYELNAFELNFDRTMRRMRQRIAERSALLYGANAEEVRAKLGRGSSLGTPTQRRKRMEELDRLVASRRAANEPKPSVHRETIEGMRFR